MSSGWPPQNTPPPGWQPQNNPPTGWQQPPGTPPPGMTPGGYVPRPPTKNSSVGCWLGGLGTCLVIVIIFVGFIAFAFKAVTRSGPSNGFTQSIRQAAQVDQELEDSTTQMTEIVKALNSYHADHGNYPSSLSALVPNYLPDFTSLHSSLDSNISPTHISFTYTQPSSDAPEDTNVLSISGSYSLTLGPQTSTMNMTRTMALNGVVQRTQSQTTTTPQ